MKKLVFLAVYLTTLSQFILAQTATISGTISIENTLETISDVYIYLDGSSLYDISDANGRFSIENIPAGNYIIRTSMIGYKDFVQNQQISKGNDSYLEIKISEAINDLPMVQINAQSGTGGALGALELPGSSHFISQKEINNLNSTNINNILLLIPGVQVQEEDGFGLRPNIGMRGTGGERTSKITLMEDGILAAPAPYSAPSAYYFPNVWRMDGIEIIKGASQIKYGPFTTGGVINFISSSIPDVFSGDINLGSGSFGMKKIRAKIGDKIGGISYIIEGAYILADGFKHISTLNSSTGFDKKDWLAKIKWESNAQASIYQSLQFKYAESTENSNETYLGLTRSDFEIDPYLRYAGSQNDEMNTKHRQMSLHYLTNPLKNLYFQTTIYNNDFLRNWYKLDKIVNQFGKKAGIASILSNPVLYSEELSLIKGRSSVGQEALYIKANNRSYNSRGIQSKINYQLKNQFFELGFRIHYDEMDRFQWEDKFTMDNLYLKSIINGIPGTESNLIESALAISSYAKYSINIKNLGLDVGLRNENIELSRIDYGKENIERISSTINSRTNQVNILIPGLSIKYEIKEGQLLFAGVHRGFSPPGSKSETNPELSVNYELGYKVQKNALFSSLVLFQNNYSNLLGADLASSGGLGTGDLHNGGASIAQGIEMTLTYRKQLNKSVYLPLKLQYTFTNARFKSNFESDFEAWGSVSNGDLIPYVSAHTFYLMTGVNTRKMQFNISPNFIGKMRTSPGQEFLDENEYVNSRWLINFDSAFSINKRTNIHFAIHNLANKSYVVSDRPAGWRPGAPRNISFSINHHF